MLKYKNNFLPKALLVLVFGWVACKKNGDNFSSNTSLLNASVNMPPVSLRLDGADAIANDSFGFLKPNIDLLANTYTLSFYLPSLSQNLFSTNTSFAAGANYTCILYDSAQKSKIYFSQDNLPTTITDGKCSMRFFNCLTASNNLLLYNDTNKVFLSNLTFGNLGSSLAFTENDTTTRMLKIVDTLAHKTLDSTRIGLQNGKIYSFYLVGARLGVAANKPKLIVQVHN